jgi:hypothetical protein
VCVRAPTHTAVARSIMFEIGDKAFSQSRGKTGTIKGARGTADALEFLVFIAFGGKHWLPASDLSVPPQKPAKKAKAAGKKKAADSDDESIDDEEDEMEVDSDEEEKKPAKTAKAVGKQPAKPPAPKKKKAVEEEDVDVDDDEESEDEEASCAAHMRSHPCSVL